MPPAVHPQNLWIAVFLALHRRPLACVCLIYLLGAAARTVGIPLPLDLPPLPVAAACGISLAGFGLLSLFSPAESSKFARAILATCAFLTGYFTAAAHQIVPDMDVSHFTSAHLVTVRGVLVSEPRLFPFGESAEMDCSQVLRGPERMAVAGKVELWTSQRTAVESHRDSSLRGSAPGWPSPGQPLEVCGVLQPVEAGASPAADNLIHHGIHAILKVGKGGRLDPLPAGSLSPGARFTGWCDGVRQWILHGLRPRLEEPEAAALAGMLFHQDDNIDLGVLDDLKQTGTVHIIATAGLHVGIVMGCCLGVLGWLLPRRAAIILTMLILAGYCAACGAHPAVVRATSVAELCLLALLLSRLPDPLTCLSLAAALMVFVEPNALLDPGFQLTFATVGVILLVMPLWVRQEDTGGPESVRTRAIHHARSIAALSAAAQLGSWPLTAYYFNTISYVGLLANLLIVPILILIIPLAMITAFVGNVAPVAATLPGMMLQNLLHLLLWIARQFALQSWTWKPIDNVHWPQVVTYYVLFGLGVGWLRMRCEERK